MDGQHGPLIIPDSDLDFNITMNVSGFLESNDKSFYVPGIACTGVVINTIVLFLCLKTRFIKPTCVPLLTLLSVSDGGFLFVLFLSWLSKSYVNIYRVSGVCQIVMFTSHLFGFVSSWIIVALVTLRFLSLLQPYKFARVCTPTMSRLLVSVFMVFTFTAYLYKTWTHGTMEARVGPYCTVYPENDESAMRLLSIIDVLLMVTVPCVVVILMQISIIVCVLVRINGKDKESDIIPFPICTYIETGVNGNERGNRECNDDVTAKRRDEPEDVCPEVTDLFLEPLGSSSCQDERDTSPTDHVTFCDRRLTEEVNRTRISVQFAELDKAKWKKTLTFSLSFICLVLPGAVENVVFMLETDKAFSNLQIYTGATHQIFQMMFYTHFALDGIIYVLLSRTFWKAFSKVHCNGLDRK